MPAVVEVAKIILLGITPGGSAPSDAFTPLQTPAARSFLISDITEKPKDLPKAKILSETELASKTSDEGYGLALFLVHQASEGLRAFEREFIDAKDRFEMKKLSQKEFLAALRTLDGKARLHAGRAEEALAIGRAFLPKDQDQAYAAMENVSFQLNGVNRESDPKRHELLSGLHERFRKGLDPEKFPKALLLDHVLHGTFAPRKVADEYQAMMRILDIDQPFQARETKCLEETSEFVRQTIKDIPDVSTANELLTKKEQGALERLLKKRSDKK